MLVSMECKLGYSSFPQRIINTLWQHTHSLACIVYTNDQITSLLTFDLPFGHVRAAASLVATLYLLVT